MGQKKPQGAKKGVGQNAGLTKKKPRGKPGKKPIVGGPSPGKKMGEFATRGKI